VTSRLSRSPSISGNEPFGSRPEPGTYWIALFLLLPPGEVPEGKAGVRAQTRGSCALAHSEAAAGNGRYLEKPIRTINRSFSP
jgi:hypothetical protein